MLSIGNIQFTYISLLVIDTDAKICYYHFMSDLQAKINELIERDRRDAEIRRLRSQGWTLQKIADQVGITKARVSIILKKDDK